MTHRVGVVGGDGIGPEVIAEGLKVIAATGVALDTIDYDLGGGRYLRDGVVLDDSTVDEWRGLDALYVGAVGTPEFRQANVGHINARAHHILEPAAGLPHGNLGNRHDRVDLGGDIAFADHPAVGVDGGGARLQDPVADPKRPGIMRQMLQRPAGTDIASS